MGPLRTAFVAASESQVAPYLPANYKVVRAAERRGTTGVMIEGRDDRGWTLHDYVLPRLASGLYFGEEV